MPKGDFASRIHQHSTVCLSRIHQLKEVCLQIFSCKGSLLQEFIQPQNRVSASKNNFSGLYDTVVSMKIFKVFCSVKVIKFRNVFTFFQKTNKNKSTSSKVEFVGSFFGRNVGLKKSI